jgi:hypothetical protein
MKIYIIVVCTIVGFLGALPTVRGASFDDVGPYFSFTFGDGGGLPADVNDVTGQQVSPDGQNLKLYGDLGPIDGARFASGFVLDWSGAFQGPINAGDKFVADVTFDVQATGGTLAWSLYADLYSGEHARILTDLMPMPISGQVSGAHFESSSFTHPADSGHFEGYLHIDWTDFSPTDTFTISIPQNSLDFTYVPVPEPSMLTLALIGMAPTVCLRSRRGSAGRAKRSLWRRW